MACTTLLVAKNASYDGSCMIARNDDSGAGQFTPKKYIVTHPDEQLRHYVSWISHVSIELPDDPVAYTSFPNVLEGEGIWAAAGVNALGVGMSATETITSNPMVQGADPLVVYDPETGTPGGIGEEDILYITLPYIKSARDGVKRLGWLLETYGTYEMNGIAFSDSDEIWYLESVGGHHWMARRVPDDSVAVIANFLEIDQMDFDDACGDQKNFMCSKDLKSFVEENNLNLNLDGGFDPRSALGSHADSDHVYNSPRVWYIERFLNPDLYDWNDLKGPYGPESDSLPWCIVPSRKITVEDIKYLLSTHYQGTEFDPYAHKGDLSHRGEYRPVGINRTSFCSLIQNRKYDEPVEWICFASNPFNVMVPFYSHVNRTPDYMANTTGRISTDNFYWSSRLISAMADASFRSSSIFIERYQNTVAARAHEILKRTDTLLKEEQEEKRRVEIMEKANEELAFMAKNATDTVLSQVLHQLSLQMTNSFSRSDA